jgi:hypothetical protein
VSGFISSLPVVLLILGGQLWNGGQPQMSNSSQLKVLDSVQGSSFLAILSVLPVFRHRNLKLSRYRILLALEGEVPTVVFIAKDELETAPKYFGLRSGSDMEMSSFELSSLMSKMDKLKVLDTLHGTSVPPIQAALTPFQQRNLNIAQYKITLISEGNSEVVTFIDKDAQPGGRGGSGGRPGFEVELNAADLRVLRSNFVR